MEEISKDFVRSLSLGGGESVATNEVEVQTVVTTTTEEVETETTETTAAETSVAAVAEAVIS
jgi:hypothetical protein